jgi:hypothetical protein
MSPLVRHGLCKEWVFVYNARRGLAPDTPQALRDRQAQYPNVMLSEQNQRDWNIKRDTKIQRKDAKRL